MTDKETNKKWDQQAAEQFEIPVVYRVTIEGINRFGEIANSQSQTATSTVGCNLAAPLLSCFIESSTPIEFYLKWIIDELREVSNDVINKDFSITVKQSIETLKEIYGISENR